MNKQRVIKALTVYYEDNGKELDELHVKAFFNAIGAATEQEILRAIERAMLDTDYPKIQVVLKHLNVDKDVDLREDAMLQARLVMHEFDIIGAGIFHDEITARVMTVYLPFEDWKIRSRDDRAQFFTPMFVKHYMAVAKSPNELRKAKAALDKKLGFKRQAKETGEEVRAKGESSRSNIAWIETLERINAHEFDRSANGIYPHRYAKPLSFSSLTFREDFAKATKTSQFEAYVSEDWRWSGPEKKVDSEPQFDSMEDFVASVKNLLTQPRPKSPFAGMSLPEILKKRDAMRRERRQKANQKGQGREQRQLDEALVTDENGVDLNGDFRCN